MEQRAQRIEIARMSPKFYVWTICSVGCGFLLVVLGLILSFLPAGIETNVLLYEHRQLYDDWNTRPFVDIIVVEFAESEEFKEARGDGGKGNGCPE